MSTRKYISEFALNMHGEFAVVLQQPDLVRLPEKNEWPDFHIYMICRRPRIALVPDSLVFSRERLKGVFTIQKGDTGHRVEFDVPNSFGTDKVTVKCEYPYSEFEFRGLDGKVLVGRVAHLVAHLSHDFLQYMDLEVLYIGQSYGDDGNRTALDRLPSHSTLQSIYAEAMTGAPDQEIWIVLWSFGQVVITSFDGRAGTYATSADEDREHMHKVLSTPITEQQRINFTEAALIRYFKPKYNQIFKESFPSPAHSTYSECYDVDLNSVCVELNTDAIRCRLWSDEVEPNWLHLPTFPIHSKEERRSMFEFCEP